MALVGKQIRTGDMQTKPTKPKFVKNIIAYVCIRLDVGVNTKIYICTHRRCMHVCIQVPNILIDEWTQGMGIWQIKPKISYYLNRNQIKRLYIEGQRDWPTVPETSQPHVTTGIICGITIHKHIAIISRHTHKKKKGAKGNGVTSSRNEKTCSLKYTPRGQVHYSCPHARSWAT